MRIVTLFFLLNISLFATEKVIIIGSGPAGLTAALFAGQSKLNPLVLGGEDEALDALYNIENYPGFPEGISGRKLMFEFHLQAEKFGARFKKATVTSVDFISKPYKLKLSSGDVIECQTIIIATGTSPKNLNVKGEMEFSGKGVSTNATRDGPHYKNKNVVVFGGGDVAMEQALFLAKLANQVTLIFNEAHFYAAAYLQDRVFNNAKIKCLFNTQIEEIYGSDFVEGIRTNEGLLKCQAVFVAYGSDPNTEIFKGQLDLTEFGYIKTKADSTKTSVVGVFAAGDVSDKPYRKVITAAASGTMAAQDCTELFLQKK